MKIAIPTENGLLCPHFGHCQVFTIIDVNPETGRIEHIESLNPPPHERGVLPAWLNQLGCTHVIAGGMGGRAVALFQQNGIQVISGVKAQKPEELVNSLLNSQLETDGNYCDDPAFKLHGRHDCGNH